MKTAPFAFWPCLGLTLAGILSLFAQSTPNPTRTNTTASGTNATTFIGPKLPTNRPPGYRTGPGSSSQVQPPPGATPNLPGTVTSPVPMRTTNPIPLTSLAGPTNKPAPTATTNAPVSTLPSLTPQSTPTTSPDESTAAAPAPPTGIPPATPPTAVPPPSTGPRIITPTPAPTTTPTPAIPSPAVPSPAAATTPNTTITPNATLANPQGVELNFKNAPLDQILEFYGNLTGRTILKAPNPPGTQTITIVSNGKLNQAEAIEALHSVLNLNGIALVPEGERFVKVVLMTAALQEGAAFSGRTVEELPESGEYITMVVQLTNALPSEVQPAIQSFSKIQGGIVAIENSQTLVLRDFAPNIKRMMEIIKKIDVAIPMDYKLDVIPIKFGRVEEIYNVMGGIIGTGGGGAAGTTGRATTGASSMRSRGSTTRRSTTSGRSGLTRPGQVGQQVTPQQTGQQSSFQQRLAQIVNRAATGGDSQLLQDARIIPDERANSLVVYANKHDMEIITNVVAKLDVMLAQVLVEAVIVDVDLNNNTSLGVSMLQNPKTKGDWTGAGGTLNGPTFLGNGTNDLGGALSSGFRYFMNYKGDLEMAVSALAASGSVTVLQKPRIQTTHAVPASFFNGRTVPYITSSYYGGAGYGNSSQYQQLEVGIGLNVTPYITPDGLVLMEVEQTIDEIAGTTKIDNNDVPITTSRTASSTVSVRDGETIFLGGFIRSSKEKSRSGVPLLKDVPLLGALFRSSSSKNDRSELVVLLRPTVLQTPADAAKALEAEKQQLPGVRLAEREFKDQEEKVQREAEKELRRKDTERDKSRSRKK